eukprot:gene24222-31491_t
MDTFAAESDSKHKKVELLISAFAPSSFDAGVVDYVSFWEDERVLDEDSFVSKILLHLQAGSSSISATNSTTTAAILPTDLRKLFQFIDNNNDRSVTVDKVIAVLNLDCISGIPAQLQLKLRGRAKELSGSGQRSAMHFFKEADQWGSKGIVTRLKMGFSLVDEPEALTLLSEKGKGGGDAWGEREIVNNEADQLLNDSALDEDELDQVIEPVHDMDSGVPRLNTGNSSSSTYAAMRQSRELFAAKKGQLEKQAEAAVKLHHQLQQQDDSSEGSRKGSFHSLGAGRKEVVLHTPRDGRAGSTAALEGGEASTPHQQETLTYEADHRVSIAAAPRRQSSSNPGPFFPEDGDGGDMAYQTHKQSGIADLTYSNSSSSINNSATSNILVVESYITRKQFAHVLQQAESARMSPADLRANVDKNGVGYVSRSDMIRTMAQLGYDNLSQITLLSMLKFFETKLEGQVNYINFLQFIHENTESQSLIHAESKLHGFSLDPDRSGLNEDNIRAMFAQIDSSGQGAFTLTDFSQFLGSISENVSKNVINAFFSEFLSSNGKDSVDFGLFLSWFNSIPSVRSEMSTVLSEICPPQELKAKT